MASSAQRCAPWATLLQDRIVKKRRRPLLALLAELDLLEDAVGGVGDAVEDAADGVDAANDRARRRQEVVPLVRELRHDDLRGAYAAIALRSMRSTRGAHNGQNAAAPGTQGTRA